MLSSRRSGPSSRRACCFCRAMYPSLPSRATPRCRGSGCWSSPSSSRSSSGGSLRSYGGRGGRRGHEVAGRAAGHYHGDSMLVVLVLLVTVAMRVAIVTAVVYLLLPRGPLCPHCAIEMVPLRNRFFDRLLPALQRRWCLECGWDGVVRRVRSARTRTYARQPTPRPPPH